MPVSFGCHADAAVATGSLVQAQLLASLDHCAQLGVTVRCWRKPGAGFPELSSQFAQVDQSILGDFGDFANCLDQ